jgi:hypothetical protein
VVSRMPDIRITLLLVVATLLIFALPAPGPSRRNVHAILVRGVSESGKATV